jgi:hypothetical protein
MRKILNFNFKQMTHIYNKGLHEIYSTIRIVCNVIESFFLYPLYF